MKRLLEQSVQLLKIKNIPEPANSVRILRSECFSQNNQIGLARNIKKFKRLIKLRSLHYPVQYLCKQWQFRDLNLKLRKPVLIPRFQSQYMITILIQKIKEKYSKQEIQQLSFVQFGCGSGALGLSLIKQLSIKGTLIDINQRCTELTAYNKKLNNLHNKNIEIITSDMLNYLSLIHKCDIVISNPPYLSEGHYRKYLKKQIRLYEDKNALVAEEDGLKYVKILIQQWKKRSQSKSSTKGIFMVQFDGRAITQKEMEWVQKFVIKDQYGRRRFILIEN